MNLTEVILGQTRLNVGLKLKHSMWSHLGYLFELEDNEHVRATAVGVHVSGSGGSGPGPLFHQLLHLHFKICTLT